MESHARSIAKALTWRFWAFLITALVVWVVTRRLEFAATIGLADTCIKFFAYYAHERLWLKFSFGKHKNVDFEI
jgi:adenylylsulfate kinase